MSLFTSLTRYFQATSLTEKQPDEQLSKEELEHLKEVLESAKKRAQTIIDDAKTDAKDLTTSAKSELDLLKNQFEELKKEYEKKDKTVNLQETIVTKKVTLVDKSRLDIKNEQEKMRTLEESLLTNLLEKNDATRKEVEQKILEDFQYRINEDTQRTLKLEEEFMQDDAEQEAQAVLVQVMKHGSVKYNSEYAPPIIRFENAREEDTVCGYQDEHLSVIQTISTVEITHDTEEHILKLYCFNTILREIARVTLERLRKTSSINARTVELVYKQVERDLNQEMLEAGKFLCHQLNVFNLPIDIVQKLGMFKYRYSYGQNMIVHTLEEAKIGIALAHELGANVNIVRLGCLFHDIGKVLYDEDPNHVTAGVQYLRKFNIPETIVACVAESHEDIPFSSIESMIVHVADSISGARPGARFDDYEGFLKHQQGLIDISLDQPGVQEAFVINGGREVRVMVYPDQVKDDELDSLAEVIREKVQEFSTYPGSIVVNVMRESQHSVTTD